MQEEANIGGCYPKCRSARLDAESKWGRSLEVKVSYGPMFYTEDLKNDIINLLTQGVDSETIAKKLGLRPQQVRAIKAHVTRGTYYEYKKELL
jgi:hypothetical protein